MLRPSKLRLDEALVARGLYQTRARARDAILRGTVFVDGEPARKPSQNIYDAQALTLNDDALKYVSRAALKLIHALDHFDIPVKGRECLDIGASSGGFTQVLLERGAAHVFAIEVGHSQMMLNDNRITLHEGLNARDLLLEHVSEHVELITCDVSFIPLHIALPPALHLAVENAHLIALIKPQFEVGREHVGKGGIVKDGSLQTKSCDDVADFIEQSGWTVMGVIASPIDGGDGNQEFLIAARK